MNKELGILSNELFDLKNRKTLLNSEVTELNKSIKLLEIKLLKEMEDQDVMKLGTTQGTVYISRQVVPKVLNWDEFYKYIREHGYFHMLERRPSRAAFRESYEQGQRVPGVDPVLFDEVRTRKT